MINARFFKIASVIYFFIITSCVSPIQETTNICGVRPERENQYIVQNEKYYVQKWWQWEGHNLKDLYRSVFIKKGKTKKSLGVLDLIENKQECEILDAIPFSNQSWLIFFEKYLVIYNGLDFSKHAMQASKYYLYAKDRLIYLDSNDNYFKVFDLNLKNSVKNLFSFKDRINNVKNCIALDFDNYAEFKFTYSVDKDVFWLLTYNLLEEGNYSALLIRDEKDSIDQFNINLKDDELCLDLYSYQDDVILVFGKNRIYSFKRNKRYYFDKKIYSLFIYNDSLYVLNLEKDFVALFNY